MKQQKIVSYREEIKGNQLRRLVKKGREFGLRTSMQTGVLAKCIKDDIFTYINFALPVRNSLQSRQQAPVSHVISQGILQKMIRGIFRRRYKQTKTHSRGQQRFYANVSTSAVTRTTGDASSRESPTDTVASWTATPGTM